MTSLGEPPELHVEAADERSERERSEQPVDVDRWAALARSVLSDEGAVGTLGLAFVDRDEIADLNAEHMGKQGPTDVLSFPLDDDAEAMPGVPVLLGDVVVSPSVAADQFTDHAGTFDDELALLVVHGVLHLLGHDHAGPDETALMRACERRHLETHHWGGPAPAGFRHDHADS